MAFEVRYTARPDWPVERLVESLGVLLTVRRRTIARQRITFLDTYDGRIGRIGATLTLTADADGHRVQWQQGDLRVGCTLPGTLQFAWHLPPGSMRQRIESIIEMRRLMPLAEFEQEGVQLDIMDETRKTIARLHIDAGRARLPERRSPWRSLAPFLTLKALRGYDKQCTGPMAILESRPGLKLSDLALQGHVLRALGTSLPQGISAYHIELDPTIRADLGLLRMHRELLRIIDANRAGVLADLDSEFLHDFRASARRSRTLLAQIDGVLPQAVRDHFTTEFAWLDQVTAPTRDLDVLLFGLRAPSSHLTTEQQGALLARLERERARTQQALVEALSSERYRQFEASWQDLLSQKARAAPGDGCGELPLATIVSQRGLRLYRRTLAGIEHVHGDTPADELHRIRIDANELCYLFDAAAGLFDPEDLTIPLGVLQRLQSVLGALNDAYVQSIWLRRYAGMLDAKESDTALAREAAEALANLAERRTAKLRKPANQQLLRFGESATRVAFERVFHIGQLTELVP